MFGNMEENAMGIFPEMLWCAVPVTIGLLAVGCYYLITGVSRGPETVQGPKQLPKQDHKPEEMVLNDGQPVHWTCKVFGWRDPTGMPSYSEAAAYCIRY